MILTPKISHCYLNTNQSEEWTRAYHTLMTSSLTLPLKTLPWNLLVFCSGLLTWAACAPCLAPCWAPWNKCLSFTTTQCQYIGCTVHRWMVLYLVVFWNFTLIKFILVLSNNGGFSIQLLKDLSFASSLISSKSVRHKLAEENLKFYFVCFLCSFKW